MRNQNFNSKSAWKTMNKGLTIGSLHTENFHISENDTGVMIVSQVYEEVLIVGLMLRLQTMLAYNHFLSAIWLSYNQLWAIINNTTSLK